MYIVGHPTVYPEPDETVYAILASLNLSTRPHLLYYQQDIERNALVNRARILNTNSNRNLRAI